MDFNSRGQPTLVMYCLRLESLEGSCAGDPWSALWLLDTSLWGPSVRQGRDWRSGGEGMCWKN